MAKKRASKEDRVKRDEKKTSPEKTESDNRPNGSSSQKTLTGKKEADLDNVNDLLDIVYAESDISNLKPAFSDHVRKIVSRYEISKNYLILFLYDENNNINERMTDKIYNAIPANNDRPILLIIHSKGGEVEPAYLISKTCKEKSPHFVVAVPRRAKSAATLISLGASEIHMGSMSELGPIDPQFANLPALGLSSSLESIAKVVSKYPKSSEMFARYLSDQLNLGVLGYFERVSESAKQYAQRLLKGKNTPKGIVDIAHAFVYEYKDHSFVIDKEEASNYLGDVIKADTDEYRLANDIHKFMSSLNLIAIIFKKKNLGIVGTYKDFTETDVSEKK